MAVLRGDYRIRREGQGDRNTALESEGCNSGAASIWLGNFWLVTLRRAKKWRPERERALLWYIRAFRQKAIAEAAST